MINNKSRNEARIKRHLKLRNKISGTATCPRLCVYRSNKNIFASIIDDVSGNTLCAASTITKGAKLENGGNIEAAKEVGKAIAEAALAKGIKTVVFDRGGYNYHGRVQALADAARDAGLKF